MTKMIIRMVAALILVATLAFSVAVAAPALYTKQLHTGSVLYGGDFFQDQTKTNWIADHWDYAIINPTEHNTYGSFCGGTFRGWCRYVKNRNPNFNFYAYTTYNMYLSTWNDATGTPIVTDTNYIIARYGNTEWQKMHYHAGTTPATVTWLRMSSTIASVSSSSNITVNGGCQYPYVGSDIVITSGPLNGQVRQITAGSCNTSTNQMTYTVSPAFSSTPSAGDAFSLIDPYTATAGKSIGYRSYTPAEIRIGWNYSYPNLGDVWAHTFMDKIFDTTGVMPAFDGGTITTNTFAFANAQGLAPDCISGFFTDEEGQASTIPGGYNPGICHFPLEQSQWNNWDGNLSSLWPGTNQGINTLNTIAAGERWWVAQGLTTWTQITDRVRQYRYVIAAQCRDVLKANGLRDIPNLDATIGPVFGGADGYANINFSYEGIPAAQAWGGAGIGEVGNWWYQLNFATMYPQRLLSANIAANRNNDIIWQCWGTRINACDTIVWQALGDWRDRVLPMMTAAQLDILYPGNSVTVWGNATVSYDTYFGYPHRNVGHNDGCDAGAGWSDYAINWFPMAGKYFGVPTIPRTDVAVADQQTGNGGATYGLANVNRLTHFILTHPSILNGGSPDTMTVVIERFRNGNNLGPTSAVNAVTLGTGWSELKWDGTYVDGISGIQTLMNGQARIFVRTAYKGLMDAGPATTLTQPIRVKSGGRYLETTTGAPVFINGSTAWSLVGQLPARVADTFLTDQASRGINLVLTNLPEPFYTSGAAGTTNGSTYHANESGVRPWTGTAFITPNEPYFARADSIFRRADSLGIYMLVDPLYIGFGCSPAAGSGADGLCTDIKAATTGNMTTWGTYIGNRYKNFTNIIWMVGGDVDPAGASLGPKVDAFVAALQAADNVYTSRVITAHGSSNTNPQSTQYGSWLNLNGIYTWDYVGIPTYASSAYSVGKPFLGVEFNYENGTNNVAPQVIRQQAYAAILGGACGHLYGNNPIWYFSVSTVFDNPALPHYLDDWRTQLNTPASNFMTAFGNLMRSINWHLLVPSQAAITSGIGSGATLASAATASDGSAIIVYTPTNRGIGVNPAAISTSRMNVKWLNPATGTTGTDYGTIAKASQTFTPPSGGPDWTLKITAATDTTIAIVDATPVTEGGNLVFTVNLSIPLAANATFTINTAGGTATSGTDFTAISNQTGTIIAGQLSTTVSVPTSIDALVEGTEGMTVTLSALKVANIAAGSITRATGNGSILDDPFTSASISIAATASGNEGTASNGAVTFLVTLNHTLTSNLTFRITTAGITATQGTDYTGQTSQLYTITAGQTTVAVPIVTIGDATVEADETFTVTIVAGSTNFGAIGNASGTGTIVNDDINQQPGGVNVKVRNQ